MARINIDDSWWTDVRRSALIRLLKDEERADGAAVRLWKVGLDQAKKGLQSIPKKVFFLLPCAQELLTCDLAEERGDEVYVKGSSDHFSWYVDGLEQRKQAGKNSAKRPRDEKGRLLKNTRPSSNENPTDVQREPNAIQPSVSSSSSDSFSEEKESLSLSLSQKSLGTKPDWEGVKKELLKEFPTDGQRLEKAKRQIEKEGYRGRTITSPIYWLKKSWKDVRQEYDHLDPPKVEPEQDEEPDEVTYDEERGKQAMQAAMAKFRTIMGGAS